MNNSFQFANISGASTLNEETIQKLVVSLSPDTEIFSQEEMDIREKIAKASSKKEEIKSELDNLEVVEHPGIKPNREKVNDSIRTIFFSWIGLVVLMFIIHCIMWCVRLVSNNSWDTWAWTTNLFTYGLIICVVITIGIKVWFHISLAGWEAMKELYTKYKDNVKSLQKSIEKEDHKISNFQSEIENINDNRARVLVQAYRLNGLPLKSIGNWNYKEAKKTYFSFLDRMQRAYENKSITEIIDFIDFKYRLFYSYSLASEASSAQNLESFRRCIPMYHDGKMNREIITPKDVTPTTISQLSYNLANYKANEMDRYINEFERILDMDTSGFFTKHDSSLLEKQTNKLEALYTNSVRFVEGFQEFATSLDEALGLCRLVAFRNIYLGAELLNIVHRGAGGGKASTSTDNIGNIELEGLKNINVASFSMTDSLNAVVSNSVATMSAFISNALSQKETRKLAANNPKNAAFAAAGAAAFGAINAGIEAWKNRNAKINDLVSKQNQIFEALEQVIKTYEGNYPLAIRSLELIEAISKVNMGFATIYSPLYKKIFIEHDLRITNKDKADLSAISKILNDYNKIAKTNL